MPPGLPCPQGGASVRLAANRPVSGNDERRRMKLRRILLTLFAGLLVGSGLLFWWAVRATPAMRDAVVTALNARFESQVDLQSLQVDILPDPHVYGRGLTLRHNGRTDVPPLITIDRFDANASLKGLIRQPLHLKDVKVEGLNVQIPPGGLTPHDAREAEPTRPPDIPPAPIAAATPQPSNVL